MKAERNDDLPTALNHRERAWLGTLLEMTCSGPIPLRHLWRDSWFDDASQRSLILQPSHGSAFLYVPETMFCEAANALAHTLEIAMLLERLVTSGLALVHRPLVPANQELRYIGATFGTPRVEMLDNKPRIILNDNGDYTDDPSTINNRQGQVLYRSIGLQSDAYELMQAATHGLLQIRPCARVQLLARLASPQQQARLEKVRLRPPLTHSTATTQHSENVDLPTDAQVGEIHQHHWILSNGLLLAISGLLIACLAAALGIYANDHLHKAQPARVTGTPLVAAPATGSAPAPDRTALALGSLPRGLDVSQWSGSGKSGAETVLDVAADIDFAFTRVAFGTRLDPEFAINWRLMRRNGLYRGAYLFLRIDQDPVTQVDIAVRAIGEARPRDLCLALDFEEQSLPSRTPAPDVAHVRQVLIRALTRVQELMQCTPLLYTNWNMGSRYLDHPQFGTYPLWIADWTGAQEPRLPPAWTRFAFWQRANEFYGSPKPADFDVFNGSIAELDSLVRGAMQ
ncbi:glycoside hydrolase family 25 protein [Pseudomonas sp. PSKL.D1]|uniref:glycoside hydrolase family 25 protein n=1 Tax=Pseudomonas sp. PSKL.D1 TaxID=3029060 RepID=UPI0023811A56|nr:GH25 family lysozyme [Pseudomonas sp. PSKL.D1]WDY59928.1 GH25 family lysozyme [Pseudomonas sp. PSKL.D1]